MPRKKASRDGVGICAPSGKESWRVKFTDPDTGKVKFKTIPKPQRNSARGREDYAARLAGRLHRRRAEFEKGGAVRTGTSLPDAIERYYRVHDHREKTLAAYRGSTDALIYFAKRNRIDTVDDLNRRNLAVFVEQLRTKPKHRAAKRGKRGAQKATREKRSAYSINRDLRGARRVLGYLVKVHEITTLTRDDLAELFELQSVTHVKKRPLKTKQIRTLLEACLRHDSDKFEATRGDVRNGTTHTTGKHKPVTPIVLFTLLTACRKGEVLRLEWGDVDLDEETVRISKLSKTHRERDIDLDVSPSVVSLLTALRLRSGGKGEVFNWTEGELKRAVERLQETYGAPTFSFQKLRVTCQSYLASAPGIYQGAAVYLTAARGGHSIAVAERHYLNALKRIPHEARTLEQAMDIADLTAKIARRKAA
jgi:integrase